MRAILLFLFCAFLGAQPRVILLSFDGLAARKFNARTMPQMWKLSREASVGEGVPPFPSTTFNGHATIATGCWPEHHGIVGNSFVDPAEGFVAYSATAEQLLREPLWAAAQRSGVKTAVYHWPCATGPWQQASCGGQHERSDERCGCCGFGELRGPPFLPRKVGWRDYPGAVDDGACRTAARSGKKGNLW